MGLIKLWRDQDSPNAAMLADGVSVLGAVEQNVRQSRGSTSAFRRCDFSRVSGSSATAVR
jgi:hypothetical protein